MVEFLRKSESRIDKIARVNSIRITKSNNLILCRVGVHGKLVIENVRAQSIYREVQGHPSGNSL